MLYDWWLSQNTKNRHIWPGLASYRVTEQSARHIPAREIVDEIDSMRVRAHDLGHILYNMTSLMKDPDSLDEQLATVYAAPALVPASPWLGARAPGRPSIRALRDTSTGDLLLKLSPAAKERVWLWTVRTLGPSGWSSEVLPGWLRSHRLPDPAATRVVVTAVSRTGVESTPAAAVIPASSTSPIRH